MKTAQPRPIMRRLSSALGVATPVAVITVVLLTAVRLSFPAAVVTDEVAELHPPPAGIGALAQLASSAPFAGTSAVGALFSDNTGEIGSHFCSASVVHSPRGNLLITAAHCVQGVSLSANSVIFAPGYHDGKFPYGKWTVTAIFMTARWQRSQDPNDDFAFLTVTSAGGAGGTMEQVTGAEQLADFAALPARAEVIGYPDSSERPVKCVAPAVPYRVGTLRQLEFTCDGYTTGTSGGPFLVNVDPVSGNGMIIGVIGGYEQGGELPMVTYSTEFRDNVAALYQAATSG